MDRTLSALPKDQVHIRGTAVNVAAHLFCFALLLMSFFDSLSISHHVASPHPSISVLSLAASPLTKTTQTNKQISP